MSAIALASCMLTLCQNPKACCALLRMCLQQCAARRDEGRQFAVPVSARDSRPNVFMRVTRGVEKACGVSSTTQVHGSSWARKWTALAVSCHARMSHGQVMSSRQAGAACTFMARKGVRLALHAQVRMAKTVAHKAIQLGLALPA